VKRAVMAACLLAAALPIHSARGSPKPAEGLPAGARELTPAEYRSRAERVAHSLEQARVRPPARAGEQALKALERLPAQASIRDPDGQVIVVDNRGLIERLREDIRSKDPTAIRRAAASLRALARSTPTSRVAVADAKARSAVAQVLRRREFRRSLWDRMRERFWRWVEQLWMRLMRRLSRVPGAARIGDVLAGLLIAGAAIVIIIGAVHTIRGYRHRPPPTPTEERAARAQRAQQPGDWLEQADVLAGRGEYREAVRALHMAALLGLDRVGIIEYHDSATDGRFLSALRRQGRGELIDGLWPLVLLFERTWYGGREAGAADYRRGRECWARVEALAAG